MGVLATVEKGALLLAYALFVVAGFATIGVGTYYATQVPGASNAVGIALACVGGGMLVVGGLACFALWKDIWLLVVIVWFLDLALFIVLMLSSILGVILGMDVRDPTRTAVDRAFAIPAFLSSHWDTGYCQEVGTYTNFETCSMTAEGGFGKLAAEKIKAAGETAWDESKYGVRDIFGDCTVASSGCLTIANTTDCVAELADDAADDAFEQKCEDCKHACREGVITSVNSALHPASIVLFATFVFTVLGVSVDRWVASTKPGGGLGQKVGFAVNGLVALLGLVMSIAVAVGYHTIQAQCPAHANCVNAAVYIVVFLGVFMFVLGVFGVLFTKLEIAPFLKCISVVHCVIALGLLVAAIFVFIVAGEMDTVHAQSEKNYPYLLEAYEQPTMGGPNFCRQAVLDADDKPIPAMDQPPGGKYMMDPCYNAGGALGSLPAECTGESTEYDSCTGTANPLAYPSATRPDTYITPTCDLDAGTDAWEAGPYGPAGPGADCPIGCDRVTQPCQFDTTTDPPTCPTGCDNLPERDATCPEGLLLSEESMCPQTTSNGAGCTWDDSRYAANVAQCPDATENRCPVYLPLSDEECRLKITVAIEANLQIIGVFAGILAAGVFVLMYFTWIMSVSMRSGGGGGESYEGDE